MSIQSLISASISLDQMKVMQSSNDMVRGKINVLKAESKQDGGDERKEALAEKMEEKSSEMMGDLMTSLDKVNESLKPDEGEKVPDSEETPKPEHSDRVEISADGKDHAGEQTEKIVADEGTTYKANGQTVKMDNVPTAGKALDVAV